VEDIRCLKQLSLDEDSVNEDVTNSAKSVMLFNFSFSQSDVHCI